MSENRIPKGPRGGQWTTAPRAEVNVSLNGGGAPSDPNLAKIITSGAADRPLVSYRDGLPQVTVDDHDQIVVRSFCCERHDAPGQCTPECAELVDQMNSFGDVPDRPDYGPPRPVRTFTYSAAARAAVDTTVYPPGETTTSALIQGQMVRDPESGKVREVHSVAPRGIGTYEVEWVEYDPADDTPVYVTEKVRGSKGYELA